jgi:NADPH:quinone reductase-like Zn-dependent oxidoreductase
MTMNAIVYEKFGSPDVLELKRIDKPVLKDNEVLIKTYTTSVNTIDIIFRNGLKAIFGIARLTTGIRKPKKKVLGFDISGEIVEIGANVTDFKVGDQIYGGARSGANAEFAVASTDSIATKATNMSYSEAGVVPMAGLSALQGLRDKGSIQKGQKVLIYGASGGIGTYAVQLAKNFEATVTAVASGKNEELVRKLGADSFIDYTKEDFTKSKDMFDVIFDTVGKSPMSRWKKALKPNGIFVNAGNPHMSIIRFFSSMIGNKFRKKKYMSFDTQYIKEDLEFLAKLAEEGKLISVIEKTYSLEEIPKAHRYYEKGHTAGKVVVNVIVAE